MESCHILMDEMNLCLTSLKTFINQHHDLLFQDRSPQLDDVIDRLLPHILPGIRASMQTFAHEISAKTAVDTADTLAEIERQTVLKLNLLVLPLHKVSTVARSTMERRGAPSKPGTFAGSSRITQSTQPSHT